MEVAYHPEAKAERDALPERERRAMVHAVEKLQALGDRLPYPHSSAVMGSDLRELRPRGGYSPWRGFYRRFGERMVILAIGPEATSDPPGFRKAVANAIDRLAAVAKEVEDHEEDSPDTRR